IHLPDIRGLEHSHFEIDDDETAEFQMIEEQIELEFFAADFQGVLAADERETHAEIQQKLADVFKEPGLKIFFVRFGGEGQEIKVVRMFQKLLGQVRLRRRQGCSEVGQRLALPAVEAGLDLHDEDISAPAVDDGLLSVPETLLRILYQLKEPHVVAPRQFCN